MIEDRTERRQFRFAYAALAVVVILIFTVAVVAIRGQKRDEAIEIQRAAERNRIIQEEKTRRTQERADMMRDIVPWSKDDDG